MKYPTLVLGPRLLLVQREEGSPSPGVSWPSETSWTRLSLGERRRVLLSATGLPGFTWPLSVTSLAPTGPTCGRRFCGGAPAGCACSADFSNAVGRKAAACDATPFDAIAFFAAPCVVRGA